MEENATMIIHNQIIQMIEEASPIPIPVQDKTNLYLDLGFDSLSFVSFLLKIEEIYLISFDITEMEICLQVDCLIALIETKVKERDIYND